MPGVQASGGRPSGRGSHTHCLPLLPAGDTLLTSGGRSAVTSQWSPTRGGDSTCTRTTACPDGRAFSGQTVIRRQSRLPRARFERDAARRRSAGPNACTERTVPPSTTPRSGQAPSTKRSGWRAQSLPGVVGDEAGVTESSATRTRRGLSYQLVGAAELEHAALVDDAEPVPEGLCLAQVVGHEHRYGSCSRTGVDGNRRARLTREVASTAENGSSSRRARKGRAMARARQARWR